MEYSTNESAYMSKIRTLYALAIAMFIGFEILFSTAGAAEPPDLTQPWEYSGKMTILTTPEGTNLPAGSSVEDFPLLVRLDKDWFYFSQARRDGRDIRFSTGMGEPLAYQIEEWDPVGGKASIWVRIPRIDGNSRQEIVMHWGKADTVSESDGAAVFNNSNGYLSVWHMTGQVKDEVGTLESRDVGTTEARGIIGRARHLAGGQGIFCGDKIPNYPTGSSPHSTEAWFRAEKPNGTVIGWGNEQGQGKVVMSYASPPHIRMDCYFSDGNIRGDSPVPMRQWVHVVHTYQKGDSRIYVNGVLDEASMSRATPLNIQSPARLWIGGWYNRYTFVGDIDEMRISNVVRSPEWIKLEYENQNPMQTLVGPIVQPGSEFAVSPPSAAVAEGKSVTFSAKAGGAQKIYWILKRGGQDSVVAVDRFKYTFDAGRVTGDSSAVLQFKAIYPDEVKTVDIPIEIKEAVAEPIFTLNAPAAWDGRSTIEIVPQVENLGAMQAAGAGELSYSWDVSDIAVIKETAGEKLVLSRAQNSGRMTVTATIDNGGRPTKRGITIMVTEPASDPWVHRVAAKDEKPEDNQFYARDDNNEGTLYYNGTLDTPADEVFLNVYADGQLYKSETVRPAEDLSYAFSVKLKPGLIRYKVELGTKTGDVSTVLRTASNIVCGDAYIIQGQSNAVATDWGPGEPTFTSPWIRSFGQTSRSPEEFRLWGDAEYRNREGGKCQIGYWGMELARKLVEKHKIPVFMINGAVGGTRIDQHQRNPENPEDMSTIYGRLLWRIGQAKLTHGIRGVFWHQGENDQGAAGPDGGYGWETYQKYFIDLAAAWKTDYPNIQHYYMFQIWPRACAMGINGSDNMLREVQRTLPRAFSNLSIMSTLGVDPPGGCHYPAAGYADIARLICPLVERDNYGVVFDKSITPPNLVHAYYASEKWDAIVLEFDQPVKWDDALASCFDLDGESGRIASGSVSGKTLTLRLTEPAAAQTLTYLDSKSWKTDNILRGENGIAALTFYKVSILTEKPKP